MLPFFMGGKVIDLEADDDKLENGSDGVTDDHRPMHHQQSFDEPKDETDG